MPQKTNLNTKEYNDDFDSSKNFYRVLFRPGYSIQTRELNTLQSILQDQIESYGKYQFKQGQQVIPGEVSFNNKLNYVKLSSVSQVAENVGGSIVFRKYDIKSLINKDAPITLTGLTSGVQATVVAAEYATDTESDTLFVNYISGGDNSEKTFRQGETLEANIPDTPLLVVGTDSSSLPTSVISVNPDTLEATKISSPAMGFASAVAVEKGVYFVNGYFVQNDSDLLIVDKYYTQPSLKVGFKIDENIVTPEQDASLYDNARGSSNFTAPGAHRLKIKLSLTSYGSEEQTDNNFIELVNLKLGVVQRKVITAEYNVLEETLARRTYDESGDYVVDNFPIEIREWYQKGSNQGLFPLRTDGTVQGIAQEQAEATLGAGIGAGKAYVRGFELVNKETKFKPFNKAREVLVSENNRVTYNGLTGFTVSNVYGTIPFNNEGSQLTAYPTLYFSSVFNDGYLGYNRGTGSELDRTTLSRRGLPLKITTKTDAIHNYATKTIYLKVKNVGNDPNDIIGKKLYYVATLGESLPATTTNYVEVLAVSRLARPDDVGGEIYAEVLVLGNKRDILEKFIDYDDADFIPEALLDQAASTEPKRRQLFYKSSSSSTDNGAFNAQNYYWQASGTTVQVESITYTTSGGLYYATVTTVLEHGLASGTSISISGAVPNAYNKNTTVLAAGLTARTFTYQIDTNPNANATGNIVLTIPITATNRILPYAEIVDYSETTTPVVGIAKPKNISVVSKGSGFNTETDKILSKGRSQTGSAVYNSVFNLEYFNPVFFTKIITDSPIVSGFAPGKYIVGVKSNAYAVIEGAADSSFSSVNNLFVRVLSGNFISGETIVDEDGNNLQIAKENTISHFIVTKRGSGYSQSTPATANAPITIDGTAIDVSAAKPYFVGGKCYKIAIQNRKLLSREYNYVPQVTINYDQGITPTSAAVVKAVLFKNVITTYSNESVKSIFSQYGSGGINSFSADIEYFDDAFVSSKNITNFTFSGKSGKKELICLAFSGDPSVDLLPGDVIQYIDDTNVIRRSFVEKVTAPTSITKGIIYLDNALQENVTNSVIVRKRTKLNSSTSNTLLFPTGIESISSLIKDSDDTGIKYYIRRDFITTSSASEGEITFSAQLKFGTQRFVPFSESNFILTVLDKGNSNTGIQNGDILFLRADQVGAPSGSPNDFSTIAITLDNLTFRTDASAASNVTLKLSATIEVEKASPRIKTAIRNKRIVISSVGDRVIPFRGYDYDVPQSQIVSYSDCFGEYGVDIKVFEGSISSPPLIDDKNNPIEGYDITYKFTFDDGQRDTFYDVSRLVLKPGFDPPVGQLIVVFNYFEHSQGDFTTIDSYLLGGVPIKDVPSFNSPALGKISLRDVIDFRPKVDLNTTTSGFQNKTLLQSSDTISFIGSAGIAAATPAHDPNISYTFGYSSKQYLDRIDGVFLTKKGEFQIKEGNASLNPSKPESPDDAIPLYYLYVPAYTYNPSDVRVIPVDNRRYTMRDIGKLEKRIERLEYYTTLSILEQQAFNTQVKDDIGFDRFKSGIIVDSFENHGVGNITSLDYQCSIDTRQSILRPKHLENSYGVKEVDSSSDSRTSNGYVVNNSLITLPFANKEFAANKFATTTINPNPFITVQYVGDLNIDPPIDHWYDSRKAPVVLNNDSKVFSVFLSKIDAREGFASLTNFYITNWIGTNRSFYNVSSLKEVSSSSLTTVSSATVNTSSNISPYNNEIGKGIQTVSNGDSVVTSAIQLFARSKAIKFNLTRLKPNTKFYAFIDGRNVYRWVCQDTIYTGIPGNSLGVFGSATDQSAIVSDGNGNASGLLIFPGGNAPAQGATWSGDVDSVVYDASEGAPTLNFPTGIKTIRFTSDSEDENTSSDKVVSFAECKYYCTGSFPSQPASIISTIPAFLKASEGIQFIDKASTESKPSPLSQTFKVENYPGGMFVTAVDLFFNKKSSNIPIRVYITDTQSGKPGSYVIPGTESVKLPKTYLRVYTNGTLQITKGEKISGGTSGVVGYVEDIIDKNSNSLPTSLDSKFTLANDQVYTIVLSNIVSLDATAFQQNEILNIPSVNLTNALNNSQLKVTICKDSGKITALKVVDYGAGYDSATLIIQSPQLPGSSNALGNIFISGGEIFESEILLEGSGYTDLPSVNIRPNGNITREAKIIPILTIDTPAVRMGVSIDPNDSQTPNSISPTRFFFAHPVYLQNNTEYNLCIETDSTEYELWSSRLGENDVATSNIITQQPLLGSVFRSQNIGTWVEDLNQDLKFVLHRASFNTSSFANVVLTNEDLGYELLDENTIQTDASSNESATSSLFRNNNKIVKIDHKNNGFENNSSYVTFKQVEDVGGLEGSTFNSNLFKIKDCGFNYYTVESSLGAGSGVIGGGSRIIATYNKKYERLYPQISCLTFSDTSFETYVKTTNIVPLDSINSDYQSYSSTDYEKTFLNEEHYFTNQKVICSYFNEIKNDISNSLAYKFVFSTNLEYLSPVIDLRSSSIKLSTVELDKGYGQEDRYGKRTKILKFYPVYKFLVVGLPINSENEAILPTTTQSVVGKTSNARGNIVRVDGGTIYVKVKNSAAFIAGEELVFTSGDLNAPSITDATVSSTGVTEFTPEFSLGTKVEVYRSDLTNRFSTKIYGTIVNWDSKSKELFVTEEKQPINDNYTTPATDLNFARNSSNGGANQAEDIIRIGDNIWHQKIAPLNNVDLNPSRAGFLEVSEVSYTNGVLFTGETSSKNSSSLAKYTTKEVTLQNPSTTLEVRLNANLLQNSDIELYYRIKPQNSQEIFDDIEWIPFNQSGKSDNLVEPSNDKVIAGVFEKQSSYKEYKYSVSNLTEFTSFAVKVVMKGTNPCYIPKIQDARIIAAF
jgi:hypothetical protein